jgi:cytochrome c oxidase subunit 3
MMTTKPKGSQITGGIQSGDGWHWDGWKRGGEGLPIPTANLGLWAFLAAVTMLFAGLSSAYLVRMALPDWVIIPKPKLLWLNTAILILSSVTVQWGWMAAKRRKLNLVRYGLSLTTMLGIMFVVGQFLVWRKLVAAGIYLQTNPASSFFYLLTAMHGLHLIGGILALVWATIRSFFETSMLNLQSTIELCAVYWHFLSIVWIWLLALILLR